MGELPAGPVTPRRAARSAGSDQADDESEVVECLDGLGGLGDEWFKRGGGEWLDDEVFAVAEGAELGDFGGVDFLPQGPQLGFEPVAGVGGGQSFLEQVQGDAPCLCLQFWAL
jgi:hypothetical protein